MICGVGVFEIGSKKYELLILRFRDFEIWRQADPGEIQKSLNLKIRN